MKDTSIFIIALTAALSALCGAIISILLFSNSIDFGPNQTVSDVVHRYNICKSEALADQDCLMLPFTLPVKDMRGAVVE